ncbi:hypothetical protein [Streptomyces sp. NPDC057375]|uniref:hypothetical protein n=1 Tax=Streptomyces sp. NPDC057375 TaxID=3346109 RepID=UPI003645B3AF
MREQMTIFRRPGALPEQNSTTPFTTRSLDMDASRAAGAYGAKHMQRIPRRLAPSVNNACGQYT